MSFLSPLFKTLGHQQHGLFLRLATKTEQRAHQCPSLLQSVFINRIPLDECFAAWPVARNHYLYQNSNMFSKTSSASANVSSLCLSGIKMRVLDRLCGVVPRTDWMASICSGVLCGLEIAERCGLWSPKANTLGDDGEVLVAGTEGCINTAPVWESGR
jgi:hypothetical protein